MHINKQISGLQYPPKTALCYGKSMNNERRGVNCIHTWFLKQKEIKSQLSQWFFPSSSMSFSLLPKSSSSFFFPKSLLSLLLSFLEKYIFSEKIYFFSQNKYLFQKNKYLPLFRICSPFSLSSPRSLLEPPFSTTFLLQPPFLLSHLRPWRPAGPPFRKFLHVLRSYCSFRKRGWFLMVTRDVTRGPLG